MRTYLISSLITLVIVVALAGGSLRTEAEVALFSKSKNNSASRFKSVSERYRKQKRFWHKEIERDAFNIPAFRSYALACFSLARATGEEAHYADAEQMLLKALKVARPDELQISALLARALMARHAFADAYSLSDRLIAQNPDEKWLLELRADASLGVGDYHAASSDVRELLLHQESYTSLVRGADLYELKGERGKAKRMLLRAVKAARLAGPEPSAWIQLRLGIYHLRAEELEEAEGYFRASLAVAPDYYLALEHLAEVYEIRGAISEAKPLLEKAIAIKRDSGLLLRLAEIEKGQGNAKRAALLQEEAVKQLRLIAEDGTEAHVRDLAEYLLDEGTDTEYALELALRDIERRPGDLRSNFILAKAYRVNKKIELAKRHIKLAVRLSKPSNEFEEEIRLIAEASEGEYRAAI